MEYDAQGVLKIIAAVLICTLLAGLIGGFIEGARAGRRASLVMFIVAADFALAQIFDSRVLLLALPLTGVAMALLWRRWRPQKHDY